MSLKWIFTDCRERWPLALGALGAYALAALATAAFAAIAGPLLVMFNQPTAGTNIPFAGQPWLADLRLAPGPLLGLAFFLLSARIVADYLGQRLAARFVHRMVAGLRRRLAAHITHVPRQALIGSSEELAARIAYDAAGLSSLINFGLFGVLRHIAMALALAAVVALVAQQVALWAALALLFSALVLGIALRSTRRAHAAVLASETSSLAGVRELFHHAEIAKSAGAEAQLILESAKKIDTASEQAIRSSDVQARLPLLVFAAVLLCALIGGWLAARQSVDLELGPLITIGIAALLLVRPLIGLAQSFLGLSTGLAALQRVQQLAALPAATSQVPERPIDSSASLSFAGVHYAYGERHVLKGVNLEVEPAQVIAILGRNGSGKSTLLACAAGHLQPRQGSVHLAEHTVSELATTLRSRHIGWLPQDPPLLRASLLDNITLFEAQPNMQRVQEVLDSLQLGNLRERLDKGLRTPLGEAEHRLSKGERQRVALARVLYPSPRILLLDEPTSGLDSGAQEVVERVLETHREAGGSILMATHQTSLLSMADAGWELRGGRLAHLQPTTLVRTGTALRQSG